MKQVLGDSQTPWQTVTVASWYGQQARILELTSGTAVWYHTGLPSVPVRWVLVRDPQHRFEPQAFLCTETSADPVQILEWFVQRWQLEVTFEEARRHLGVETQRHWSDKAIARTTPALFGLYSLVVLMAQGLLQAQALPVRTAAWYTKPQATFSDTIAWVRRSLWHQAHLSMSHDKADMVKIPKPLLERLTDTLCYAA